MATHGRRPGDGKTRLQFQAMIFSYRFTYTTLVTGPLLADLGPIGPLVPG